MNQQSQKCSFGEFYDSGCQSCDHVCMDPTNKNCHDVCPKYAAYKLSVNVSDQHLKQEVAKLRNEIEEEHQRNMIIIACMSASIATIVIIITIVVTIKYRKEKQPPTHAKHQHQMEEGLKGSLSTLESLSTREFNLSDETDTILSLEDDQIIRQESSAVFREETALVQVQSDDASTVVST